MGVNVTEIVIVCYCPISTCLNLKLVYTVYRRRHTIDGICYASSIQHQSAVSSIAFEIDIFPDRTLCNTVYLYVCVRINRQTYQVGMSDKLFILSRIDRFDCV